MKHQSTNQASKKRQVLPDLRRKRGKGKVKTMEIMQERRKRRKGLMERRMALSLTPPPRIPL